LEPHIANSRGLHVEVINPSIITRELLTELSDSISRIDPRWEVYLSSGDFDFGVFISATEAQIWTKSDSALQWRP
jgi:hypothetical protein